MTALSVVRKAIPQDKNQIMDLLALMHEENGMFAMDELKVEAMVDRTLHPDRIKPEDWGFRGMAGVIGSSSSLEALILLVIGSPWYTSDITLEDAANYVHPECRKSNHAKALIGYAKMITDAVRQDHPNFRMILGVVSNKRTAAKVRLYQRQLSEPVGAFFFYPRPDDDFKCQIKG